MSTKVTAARIYQYGEPDVFRFETMDVHDPVGHEVLVRNTVIGLNFVDIYYRRGTLPVPEFPAIIGDEASGVVEAVGPNVTLVKVGDRVAYADAFGAYTTVRLYPEDSPHRNSRRSNRRPGSQQPAQGIDSSGMKRYEALHLELGRFYMPTKCMGSDRAQ
jgi:hypothetical protein